MQLYLTKSDGVGVGEDSDINQHIRQVHNVEKPEKSHPNPGSSIEYRQEERGESQEVYDGVHGEDDFKQVVLGHHPDDEVEEEDEAEGEVNLKSDNLVPADAFLQESPGRVNDVDDHGDDVADEDDDHQELAAPALPAGGALRPVLELHREGRGLRGEESSG